MKTKDDKNKLEILKKMVGRINMDKVIKWTFLSLLICMYYFKNVKVIEDWFIRVIIPFISVPNNYLMIVIWLITLFILFKNLVKIYSLRICIRSSYIWLIFISLIFYVHFRIQHKEYFYYLGDKYGNFSILSAIILLYSMLVIKLFDSCSYDIKRKLWVLIFCIIPLLFYLFFNKTCNKYLLNLAYLDYIAFAFFTIIVLHIISYFFPKKPHLVGETAQNHNFGADFYIDDLPIKTYKEDILGFSDDAIAKAREIAILSNTQSWSIAISAPWGHGKTSYLNLLVDNMGNEEFEFLYFNPSHSASSEYIQQDFFNLLMTISNKYEIPMLDFLLRRYILLIKGVDKYGIFETIIEPAIDMDKGSIKRKINEVISRMEKRLIIFIDDLDRINSDELKEVFKILRGTADFHNTIFISAFDKSIVTELIEEGHSVKFDGNRYIEKYFDIQYSLPLYDYSILYKYIRDQIHILYHRSKKIVRSTLIELDTHKALFMNNIHTMRDAKKFVNLLFMSYRDVIYDLDLIDLSLLALLKLTNENMFRSLYNREWEIQNNQYIYKEKDGDMNIDILKKLFILHDDSDKRKRINNIDYFDRYFKNKFIKDFTKYDFISLLSVDVDKGLILKIDEAIKKNSKELLYYILNMVNPYACRHVEILLGLFNLMIIYEKIKHEDSIIERLNIYTASSYLNSLSKVYNIKYTLLTNSIVKTIDFSDDIEFSNNEALDNIRYHLINIVPSEISEIKKQQKLLENKLIRFFKTKKNSPTFLEKNKADKTNENLRC